MKEQQDEAHLEDVEMYETEDMTDEMFDEEMDESMQDEM